MPVIDLQSVGEARPDALTVCDLCIVGSGPAGSTIARELSGTGMRVTLLESGGFVRSSDADALNTVENVGYPRLEDQWAVRNRIVGGSSHTWGGRCAPFDAIDLERRPWIADSGWPFAIEELTPYLDRSAAYLGLAVGHGFSDERFWSLAGHKRPRFVPHSPSLLPFFWQFSRDTEESYLYEHMRLGRNLAERLGSNVTLVTGATVSRVDPVASGRSVASVEIAAKDGSRCTLSTGTVVLCGGGIENARLLLCSDTIVTKGLGNDRDIVGRYFMDHLRGPVGSFEVAGSASLQKCFGRYNVRGNLFRAGLRLSPEVQAEERLLNCAAWLGETLAPDDPWNVLKRVIRGKPDLPGDLLVAAANAGLLLRGLKDYIVEGNGVPRKLESLTLDCMCDQTPDRDSRVMLSDQRDRHGMRRPLIDWRVHDDEARTARRIAKLASEEFSRMNLPALKVEDWVRDGHDFPKTFKDVAHPSGTTRMSEDPCRGVVDASCRVHGIDGLYIAGSSIFPTIGHCNPTQMIVALALRLADRLKTRAADNSHPIVQTRCASAQQKTRVLVTGATGRIGRVVVSDLLDRGYRVRATTSKEIPAGDDRGDALEWQRFDFQASPDYDVLVAGCAAVLHIGAEMADPERMWRANVEATGWLAAAAEREGVKAFCYTSSVAVYGSGREPTATENAPLLTVENDIRSEYWAIDQTRAYGRTKLGGEYALREHAKSVRYTILRPTVVVSVAQIVDIREWSRVKRHLTAHRHAHHVFDGDVSDAIIWFMQCALDGKGEPGSIATYNLSEDEFPEPTHADFMRKAFAVNGDRRFRVLRVPPIVDWMRDFLRFRTLPLRHPGWSMRFPNDRLRAAGYRPRFGLARAYELALQKLRDEAELSTSDGQDAVARNTGVHFASDR